MLATKQPWIYTKLLSAHSLGGYNQQIKAALAPTQSIDSIKNQTKGRWEVVRQNEEIDEIVPAGGCERFNA